MRTDSEDTNHDEQTTASDGQDDGQLHKVLGLRTDKDSDLGDSSEDGLNSELCGISGSYPAIDHLDSSSSSSPH
jgi:hypothetical protein